MMRNLVERVGEHPSWRDLITFAGGLLSYSVISTTHRDDIDNSLGSVTALRAILVRASMNETYHQEEARVTMDALVWRDLVDRASKIEPYSGE